MDTHSLFGRKVINFGAYRIDTEHLNRTETDPVYWAIVKQYCTLDSGCPMEIATIRYRPNMAGNIIYMVLFFLLLGGQLFYGIKNKTWAYMSVISLGIIAEIAGYIGRILLNQNPWEMNNFLANLIPLTLAPALLTAGIYMSLCRVIVAKGEENSKLNPQLYTIIFIGFDLLSLILQGIGGGMAATANDDQGSDMGKNIMIAGLISQVISMGLFMIVWSDFALRVRRNKISGAFARNAPPLYENIRRGRTFTLFQWTLFIATLLIFVRCFYRVAELWDGFSGHLANDEVTFMILEGPMIIGAVALMTIFHPGRIFGNLWISAGKRVRSVAKDFDDSASTTELSHGSEWESAQGRYTRV